MYKSYIPYLQHILDECLYVCSVIKEDMQMEQFLHDETLKRAVTRSLSIIGEATKKIPADGVLPHQCADAGRDEVNGAGEAKAGQRV